MVVQKLLIKYNIIIVPERTTVGKILETADHD
jgi:hypothetical protein